MSISIYPPIFRDFGLEVAAGNVDGYYAVHKFGHAPDGVQTTATDLWVRADATPTQQIWVAPTAARIHTIASTSANDTTGGTGANSVIVYYLPDWDTAETTETVTGNLNAGIAMSNSAVMINRMKVVPQSTSTTANVGTITATAAVDATVTAQINPDQGQTEQAIFGWPSTQKFFLNDVHASVNDVTAGSRVDLTILLNPAPDVNTTVFITKGTYEIQTGGSSASTVEFIPARDLKGAVGPGIVKIQGTAASADTDCSCWVNGYLVDV